VAFTFSAYLPSYLRKVLFQIGWVSCMNHEVYQQLRAGGKNFKTCILAPARKFLRFLFACLRGAGVHHELRRPGVTLMPIGNGRSRCCRHL
jgi:hypothetical protein